MAVAILISLLLLIITVLFHFMVLSFLSGQFSNIAIGNSFRILAMVIVAFSAHVIEASVYAIGYKLAETADLGIIAGKAIEGPLDYFYFSIVTFTSLGLGDLFPIGHLRFIAGIETLNGLVLIAWTGSFLFVAMNRMWPWQDCK